MTRRDAETVHEIHVGIATATDFHVLDGVDLNVSVNGIDGNVTLAPSADGQHGYDCSWAGEPSLWVESELLAYIQSLPDPQAVLRELADTAGAEADARPPSEEDIAETNADTLRGLEERDENE
jgi:hypothetical protein